jgi:glycerol kinase
LADDRRTPVTHPPEPLVLAVDQGTTSTRAILFGRDGRARSFSQVEHQQFFPRPGWV